MPDETINTDAVAANDIQAMINKTNHIAAHLAKIDASYMKLAAVNPGPPQDQTIVANLKRIAALANHIEQVSAIWLQGGQANLPPSP